MSNSIAPGSSADVNVKVTALTTNPNVPVTYKTIILKKNLVNGVNTLIQEMMSTTNTKYVVKYDYVLGEDVTVPANCVLEFDGGSISGSSGSNMDTIIGQNTIINSVGTCFDNILLSGTFQGVGHICWFKQNTDITNQINSLIGKGFYKVFLEYGGTISGSVSQITEDIEIDGCFSTIRPYNCTKVFWSNTSNSGNLVDNIVIKNVIFDYNLNDGITSNSNISAIVLSANNIIDISNIEVKNYRTAPGKMANFDAIYILPLSSTITKIVNTKFINLELTADNVETTGYGALYAICVANQLMSSRGETKCGPTYIYNCYIDYLQTVDVNGNLVKDDPSGIYIAMAYNKDASNIIIDNCYFKDCGKRNIKLQGDGITCRNLNSEWTSTLSSSLAQYYIGTQYSKNIIIENCRGYYPGIFAKVSDGDNITIKDCNINTPSFLFFSTNTNANAFIENCKYTGGRFLYCTIDSVTDYTGIPDTGIIVKDCNISINDSSDYFLSTDSVDVYFRQYGKVLLNNCNINVIAKGLANREVDISFISCNIKINKSSSRQAILYSRKLYIQDTNIECVAVNGADDEYFINATPACKAIVVKDSFIILSDGLSCKYCFDLEQTSGIRVFENVKTSDGFTYFIYNRTNAINSDSLVINNIIDVNKLRFGNNIDKIIITNTPTAAKSLFNEQSGAKVNNNFRLIVNTDTPDLYFDNTTLPYVSNNIKGTFSNKPINCLVGHKYFCTSGASIDGGTTEKLNIPIYYTGSGWVDANGTVVVAAPS